MKKRILPLLLIPAVLMGVLGGCGTAQNPQTPASTDPTTAEPLTAPPTSSTVPTSASAEPEAPSVYSPMAAEMLDSVYGRFWTEGKNGSHLRPIHAGARSGELIMIWETAMLMLAMENYYHATLDPTTKQKIADEWAYLQQKFTREQMVSNCGSTPNLASDDTAWSALLYMSVYRVLGDETALDCAREVILNAYEYYADGDISNGLWYCDTKQYGGDQWKSLYSAGFLLAGLEYCEATQGTDRYSQKLFDDTMALYGWMEENLRRSGPVTFDPGLQNGQSYTVSADDGLYWCDYNWDRDGRDERFGPDGGIRPNHIYFGDSISFLYGNMAMAAVNMKLSEVTGDPSYRERALQTVDSIVRVYTTADGTYLNDRDPYTNGAALYYYVTYVLTDPDINPLAREQLFNTADVIYTHCRMGDSPCFSTDWDKTPEHFTNHFVANATTLSFVCGAAYAEKLGLSAQ